MIFNYYITNLWYFFKTAILLWCKPKTITTDNRTGMKDNITPNDTIKINLNTGMDNSIITHCYIVTKINTRKNFRVVAYFHIFTQVSKCADKNIFAIFCRGSNKTRLLQSFELLCHQLLVFIQKGSKCGISVRNTDKRLFYLLF